MNQTKVYDERYEVNGTTILSFVHSMEKGKETRIEILKEFGLENIEPQKWYRMQAWLDAFRKAEDTLGPMHLYLIGKAILEHAKFPPISHFKQALSSLDIACHLNHRINGEVMFNHATGKIMDGIGNLKLTSFDEERKKAIMVVDTPYPSKFEEGIINQLVRKFKPSTSAIMEVKLDPNQETRSKGGDSCTYLIFW